MISYEFTIDEVPYLLKVNCHQLVFPTIRDRVIKFIQTRGKSAAENMFAEAKATGYSRINKTLYKFELTINPQGNNFQ